MMRMLIPAQYATLILAVILKRNSGELVFLNFKFLLLNIASPYSVLAMPSAFKFLGKYILESLI